MCFIRKVQSYSFCEIIDMIQNPNSSANTSDEKENSQDLDSHSNNYANNEINNCRLQKNRKRLFSKAAGQGFLRNQVGGDSQLSLGQVNKPVNRFDRGAAGKHLSSENLQYGDNPYHRDDIQHVVTHELGSSPNIYAKRRFHQHGSNPRRISK